MASRHENLEDPVTSVIEETIYVAVGIDVKECKSTLLWALHNNGGKKICIIHVHRPAQRIPSNLGGGCPAGLVDEKIVREYRKTESQNMNETLKEYLSICREKGVEAQSVWIEMGDIGKGIIELISHDGIKDLVMGGALDKHYKEEAKHLILRSVTWEPDKDNIESRASNCRRSKSVRSWDITEAGPSNHMRLDLVTPKRGQAQGELTIHMISLVVISPMSPVQPGLGPNNFSSALGNITTEQSPVSLLVPRLQFPILVRDLELEVRGRRRRRNRNESPEGSVSVGVVMENRPASLVPIGLGIDHGTSLMGIRFPMNGMGTGVLQWML
nr:u-box domain-containing protein 33 [Quercus suber]